MFIWECKNCLKIYLGNESPSSHYLPASVQTLNSTEILGEEDKNYTYLDLIKTPKMRQLTLLTGIVWWVSLAKNTYKDMNVNRKIYLSAWKGTNFSYRDRSKHRCVVCCPL